MLPKNPVMSGSLMSQGLAGSEGRTKLILGHFSRLAARLGKLMLYRILLGLGYNKPKRYLGIRGYDDRNRGEILVHQLIRWFDRFEATDFRLYLVRAAGLFLQSWGKLMFGMNYWISKGTHANQWPGRAEVGFLIVIWTIAVMGDSSLRSQEAEPFAFFENKIRPLLVDRCIECHSSGSGKSSGGLALDSRIAWMKGGDSGVVIVPGDPDESLLIKAVRYHDAILQMPPQETGGKLRPEEIDALIEWVRIGAPDPREAEETIGVVSLEQARGWWSFQPIKKIFPPDTHSENPFQSPIDRFWQANHSQLGIQPNARADRRTLIRRATFDLTGLPPTLEEIAAFESDQSPEAFARVIDRLLDSPAYGERWGRHWLDVARYADTAGDGSDYPVREAYKYRDWVIDALNSDKPIDDFLREQIAGDLLADRENPEDYAAGVTATGFLAIGKRYGYAPNADFQHLDFADAIDSIGRSILGLSVGCARCHDHKYEPITMADYYAWYGILESTSWSFPGGEEQKRPSGFPPLVSPAIAAKLDQQKAASIAAIDKELQIAKSELITQTSGFRAGGIDLDVEQQMLGKPPGGKWLSAGPNAVLAEAQSPFRHIHPTGGMGIRVGSGVPNDGVRYVFENSLTATPGNKIYFSIDFRSLHGPNHPGAYRFYLGRGVIASQAVECSVTQTEVAIKDGTSWRVIQSIEPGKWYNLQLTIDGQNKTYDGWVGDQQHRTEFSQQKLSPNWDGVIDTFICDAIGHVPGKVCERDLDNVGLGIQSFAALGTISPSQSKPMAVSIEKLKQLETRVAELQKLREMEMMKRPYEVAYGVSEGTAKNAKIQKRGEPDKLGEEVPRRNLTLLGGTQLPSDYRGSGRLYLANWLSDHSNPLTARVFVNRVWEWHFGEGIVSTSSDFGLRGELPRNPQLLDWLAAELIDSGWSLKKLHRLIMLSETYQRSSEEQTAALQLDPSNQHHWRFSRRSLDAESIRDAMLVLSGQLERRRPAEHPFPPVETWNFTIHNPFHAIYESAHRSVYLMSQRNRRHPYLALFDSADPNISTAQRQPTITPNQTLYLMNSPFVHAQAKSFAQKIMSISDDSAIRVKFAIESATGRIPDTVEVEQAISFINQYRNRLIELKPSAIETDAEAWSALARILLTSNAFLYVD